MNRHIPHRQCAGCGARRPQNTLVRVAVRSGAVVLDRGRTLGGRGAYLCPNAECARRAARRDGLSRRLRQPLSGVHEIEPLLELERRDAAWKD